MDKGVRIVASKDGTQTLTKQERDARSKRHSRIIQKIKKYISLLADQFRTANMIVVIESGLSNNFPIVAGRHAANDSVWRDALLETVQRAILTKTVRPQETFAGLIAPLPVDRAGLAETISEAEQRGVLSSNQVLDILTISTELKKGVGKCMWFTSTFIFQIQTDSHPVGSSVPSLQPERRRKRRRNALLQHGLLV
jgi:hypothetical protein